MDVPKISVTYSNGNLLADVGNADGYGAIVGTGATAELLGKCLTVFSLSDAERQGITKAAEPAAYRHIAEFYAELGGNQKLYVLLLANTATMESMLDDTNEDGAKKLMAFANGEISKLAVFRNPPGTYDPGDDFLDADVSAAVLKAKGFMSTQVSKLRFARVLIEGRVAVETSNTIYSPSTAAVGVCGVVLGGSANDGSASVGAALGRSIKYGAHIKLGKVANGPLSLTKVYIGTKELSERADLETLHGKGYISFMTYANKAGYYFGIDNMASTDDYRLLVYGAVVDKAARIAVSTYVEQLEGEFTANPDGTITDIDAQHLEDVLKAQIDVLMAGQFSSRDVKVDRTANVIQTSKIPVKVRIMPLAYASFIDIDLGLTGTVTITNQ